ncbi:MAG: hypothetical protein LAP85_08550 [Acidobacteriia bacterium]|nr:hypothetical protein [Terriglobia bacterium]
MSAVLVIVIGLAAGFHAALYGAYKDSPHESFMARRFVRELVFATGVAAVLAALHLSDGQTPFVIYLSVFALARIITEFWKLFLRVEPQEDFRIPTQVHWVRGVVHDPIIRLIMGIGFLAGIYGCYRLFRLLPHSLPWVVTGLIVGCGIGLAEAMVGAYKDGTIEGFSFRKFLKSPTFGTLGGLVACFHTTSLAFLLLAAIGTMRMFNELLFKMIVRDYTPGKFKSMVGPFQEWMTRRRFFLPPYAATWLLYLVLFARLS